MIIIYKLTYNFKDGFARVEKEDEWNFINRKGELVNKNWHYDMNIFDIVKKNNKYNFINQRGELIGDIWYDWAIRENDYIISVIKNGKYNFINKNGNLISKTWYDDIERVEDIRDLSLVKKNKKYNFINKDCKLLFDFSNSNDYFLNKNFLKFNDKVICRNIDMDDYEVKKNLFGYTCKNSVDSYKVKYMPIKRYGLRYTLCLNQDKVLLYDRIDNQYTYEWSINVEYDDNFIFDRKNKKIYLMYENQMIEITEYYNKYLKDKKITKINSGITGIISREEFSFLNRDKIDEIFKEIKEEKKKKEELEKKEENERKLEEMKLEKEKLEQEKRNAKLDALENIRKSVETLRQLSDSNDKLPKMQIEEKDLFVKIEDHLEISKTYLPVLKFIDLGYINFDNVKIDGIDFRETNLNFDPQKVYKKNLRNCNFEKIYISPFINFKGVDIRGCHFSEDDNPTTDDHFNLTFKDAIYDATTTYNGISFTKILGDKVEDNNETKKNNI